MSHACLKVRSHWTLLRAIPTGATAVVKHTDQLGVFTHRMQTITKRSWIESRQLGTYIWGRIVPAVSHRYYNLAIMKPGYNTGKTRDGCDLWPSAEIVADTGPPVMATVMQECQPTLLLEVLSSKVTSWDLLVKRILLSSFVPT